MKCAACGELVPELKFCDQCGADLKAGAGGGAAGAAAGAAVGTPSAAEAERAAKDEAESRRVARSYVEARKVVDFVNLASGRPDAFLDAYARAFLGLGQYGAAAALLKAKRNAGAKDRDMCVILERAMRELEAPSLFKGAQAHRARMGAAVQLAEKGLAAEAACLMDEEAVLTAAIDDVEAMQVARMFQSAGRTHEFLNKWSAGREPGFYAAYAAAFVSLKEHAAALALLEMKKPLAPADYPAWVACLKALKRLGELDPARVPDKHRLAFGQALIDAGEDKAALEAVLSGRQGAPGKEDYALALRACMRLGDFNRAGELFSDLAEVYSLKDAPELHYLYALASEKQGCMERAQDIYRKLFKRFGGYKDVGTRLKNIEAISTADRTRLTSVVASQTSAPAAAPGLARPAPELIAGRYEVRRTLGFGGMGVVYRGWDRELPRDVAIKRMRDEVAVDPQARERFLAEARIVAGLNHPYIVAIHDIRVLEKEVYLVFEFVDGETVHELLSSRGRLPAKECGRILGFVCEALAYAHGRKVVHRDLKPGNIMMDRQGYVKVMDFGIAAQAGAEAAAGRGTVIGTPYYMAPEQHAGRASPLADIFALGATAYEMLAGKPAFTGPDFQGQKAAEAYQPLPADVPAGLRDLIGACLKPRPEDRPKGAAALAAGLRGP